jgi:hypothetical protein
MQQHLNYKVTIKHLKIFPGDRIMAAALTNKEYIYGA